MPDPVKAWSFSALNTYLTCPRQYDLTYNKKVILYKKTQATKWGKEVHKALEDYVGAGVQMGAGFLPYKKIGDHILAMPGEKFVERQIALTRNLEQTGYFAKDVWVRSVLDITVLNGDKAFVGDYKTGKVQPDSDQLMLSAAVLMAVHPEVNHVKTAYLWVAHPKQKPTIEKYTRDDIPDIWEHFLTKTAKLQNSVKTGNWPPKPSGLCRGWCGAGKANCEFWSPKE